MGRRMAWATLLAAAWLSASCGWAFGTKPATCTEDLRDEPWPDVVNGTCSDEERAISAATNHVLGFSLRPIEGVTYSGSITAIVGSSDPSRDENTIYLESNLSPELTFDWGADPSELGLEVGAPVTIRGPGAIQATGWDFLRVGGTMTEGEESGDVHLSTLIAATATIWDFGLVPDPLPNGGPSFSFFDQCTLHERVTPCDELARMYGVEVHFEGTTTRLRVGEQATVGGWTIRLYHASASTGGYDNGEEIYGGFLAELNAFRRVEKSWVIR